MTPQMSPHARLRCREMGISTKRAKRIFQHHDTRYAAHAGYRNGGFTLMWSGEPDIAIVVSQDMTTVITVLERTQEEYERASKTRRIAPTAVQP